ncbi:ABC transporter ATP-binding protein [Rhodospirillaceae bacterium AH-315-P19]|nr:ABC transporter ATP-binding protein [Rhodospirillaceae bacterium AH-315-P19]
MSSDIGAIRTIGEALRESLMPFRWLIGATVILSVLFGFSAIVGITAFVPVISIIAGHDLSQLEKIPYIGPFVLSLSQDREMIFYTMVGAVVTISFAKAGLQLVTILVEAYSKTKVDSLWQQRVLTRWLNAPYRLHGSESAGRIMHLTSREVVQMSLAARAFVQLVSGIVQGSIAMAFLAFVAPVALFGVCLVVLCILVPLTYIVRSAYRVSQENAMLAGNYINRTHEVVKRIEMIDVFGTAEQEKKELFHFYSQYLKSYLRLYFNNALSPFVTQIALAIIMGGLMIFFFRQGVGQETLATMVLFVGGMVLIHPQIDRVTQAATTLARVGAAYEEIRKVTGLPAREPEPSTAVLMPNFDQSAVAMDAVSFSYESSGDSTKIIDDVSFDLPPGGLYMVFGPTGAGKTTLLKLMQRLLTPDSGDIRYGGVKFSDVPQKVIPETVLMLNQERPTFTGTIRENLVYGLKSLSEESLNDAVRLSGLEEFLDRLPSGLDTHIGNDGSLLSGGQRQRIALARLIASSPKVMLLDEPTSALDREMEHKIMGTLFELRDRGHTIIMSTHKVELSPFADKVLWFENGKIHVGKFEDFYHSLAKLIPHEGMRDALAFPSSQKDSR